MTNIYVFKWNEGQYKRMYEAFDFAEGFKKVLNMCAVATDDNLQVSGLSCKCWVCYTPKHLIFLRSF